MRCLYIVAQDPISPNHCGGASALYYDQLLALSSLGCEIHLWHFASADRRAEFERFTQREPKLWASVIKHCKDVQLEDYNGQDNLVARLLARIRACLPPRLPLPRWTLYRRLSNYLRCAAPDLIWAQHLEPTLLAAQQTRVPFVYVHHDWLYRIKALRNHRPINLPQKAMEERLVRRASAVVSGSYVECQEIAAAGCRNVHYIPVTYEPVAFDPNAVPANPARVVHLGGLGTTANREGLVAFLEQVWPALQGELELWLVGDTSAAPEALKPRLSAFHCTGFVPDLATVLRPFDIQVIPWQHATGQRTRLPVAFNHAQVVVATRAAVACYPEAMDGQNCRLVNDLSEMPAAIKELSRNPGLRAKLGRQARATFEASFSLSRVVPKYAAVVEGVLKARAAQDALPSSR